MTISSMSFKGGFINLSKGPHRSYIIAVLILAFSACKHEITKDHEFREKHRGVIKENEVPKKAYLANIFFEFSNYDVLWWKVDSRIEPRLDGHLMNIIQTISEDRDHRELHDAELLDLLSDGDRYILAHVILTQRTAIEYVADGHSWNGLEFVFTEDSSLTPQSGQQERIRKQWLDTIRKY